MNTLKLFNAVTAKPSNNKPYISDEGYIIAPNALWAKDKIIAFLKAEKLNGNDLNKTFHKSWSKIKNSSRYQLYVDQIEHYVSTYGSNFQEDIYIPDETLNIPDLKLNYKVINAYSKEVMTQKCMALLQSGIALKEDTIDTLLTVLLDELGYTFSGKEKIKNKEATVKLAEFYNVYPDNPVEFFRYVIYRATGSTLLIKNDALIELIKNSNYNPAQAFNSFGLEKLAEIFNRYKPLFLAFKNRAPKTINKISKLSKTYHKPLVSNPLNDVTNTLLTDKDVHWLDNATPFALFKALSACYTRAQGQDAFLYRIRNGKSWATSEGVSSVGRSNILANLLKRNKAVKSKKTVIENPLYKKNYNFLLSYLKQRFDLSGKRLFFPEDITYALPTSEKMYVGNIPTGTRFYGKKLAVGVYWEDAWGARDLDLSGLNIAGKIGWNATYNQQKGSLMYSGDITSAPNGAVEYLYANKGLNVPTLVQNNVYSGTSDCGYKIVIGKGSSVSKDYMMNPNKVFADIKCESVQKQTILGMLIPKNNEQCFVLLNFGAGHSRVSSNSEVSTIATRALYQQWNNALAFDDLVRSLGAEITDYKDEADFDFSLENLEKDSFIKLFN
ncbi:MAG: hypothetical protein HRU50_07815 [Winogradskyella sp.]|uniref:hypothetical protein n=1 Tax=Winogradskyella sp. TaxID=1883156 RepID=UPI0025D83BAA|nr:hypothetical protein [Winogradskyella sp.]NRB59822.1 hypothetical protein [Winogradskyella sp.]